MELSKKLKFLKSNIIQFLETGIKNTEKQLIELQQDQMAVGENAEGNEIGTLRNLEYAKRKKQKGGIAKFGQVDLKNTGDFYDAIYLKISKKYIEISSSDWKTDSLEKKYGEIIFGLNEYYKQKYSEILIMELQNLIRKYLVYGTKP